MNKLEYGYGSPEIKADEFKISPSGLKDFFNYTHLWFEKQFLGENSFAGNTLSVRGTYLHWLAENYHKDKTITQETVNEAKKYLDIQYKNLSTDEFDIQYVLDTVDDMWTPLKHWIDENYLLDSEIHVSTKISNHVVLSGKVDYIKSDLINGGITVGDYKTSGPKTIPKKIEYQHRLQLLAYAYAMEKMGRTVGSIECCYIIEKGSVSEKTGKQLSPYENTVISFSEPYTNDLRKRIKGQIKLVAETMELFFTEPQLAYILFKDYRLKGKQFNVLKFKENSESDMF